jgi:ATP-binding cassette subfamily C protein
MQQNVFLFDDTLKNNITLYNSYPDEKLNDAIESAGLSGVIKMLEKDSQTFIGESGNTLSGGERQRIAIARSLIRGCDILILDEATANLDNETAYNIEKSLIETPDLTCIFVTHRYTKDVLSKCDDILVMRDGELIEHGTFDSLYNRKGYFYSLYNITSKEVIENDL